MSTLHGRNTVIGIICTLFLISFSYKEKAEDTIHVFFAFSSQPVLKGRVKLRDIIHFGKD